MTSSSASSDPRRRPRVRQVEVAPPFRRPRQFLFQVQPDVFINARQINLVQQKYLSEWFQERKAEPSPDARFGSPGDEELHGWQSLDETAQNGQDRGGGLIVNALVQSVHDDDARELCERERIYNQVLEL